MPATATKLFERVEARTGRVDRQRGVIRGVRIIGHESRNGRTYTESALRRATALYEGCKVCIDHPARHDANIADRSMKDFVGTLRNVEYRAGAVYADLYLLTNHAMAGLVLEAAEKMPTAFGLSHHAEGKVVRKNGKAVVEDIEEVFSVDLVLTPATNRGLFESYRPRPFRFYEGHAAGDDYNLGALADKTGAEVDEEILAIVRSKTMSTTRKMAAIEKLLRALPAADEERDPLLTSGTPESFARRITGRPLVENAPRCAAFAKRLTSPEPVKSRTATTGRKRLRETASRRPKVAQHKPAANAAEFARRLKSN